MHASTPLILRKSRMRRRARTDLCGGRSAMVVPTATVRSYRFEDRYTRISSVLDFLTRRRLRRQLRSSGGATALGLDKNKLRRNSFTVAATRMKQHLSSPLGGYRGVSPTFDHLINGLMNRVTGVSSAVAAHKQLIVSRVTVADGRNHSGGQSLRFETSPGGRATHPTAAPQRRVCCDNSRFSRRTARKQFQLLLQCAPRACGHPQRAAPRPVRGVAHAAGHPQGILVRRAPGQPPQPRCLGVRAVHVIC
jgi:hypothetical protein